MRTVLRYLLPFRRRMTVGFVIKVLGTVVELFLPMLLTYILKSVIKTASVPKILLFGGLMILCSLAALILNVIANRMAARVSRDFSEQMRRDLFDKTLHLSAAQTDQYTIPSLESRITTDTYHVQNFIGMMQRMGVRAPILLLGGIVITLLMDVHLALVMLALLPFIFFVVYGISRHGVPLYKGVQSSVDSMVRVVREDVQGIRVIKALSKNEYENRRYDQVNSRLSADERYAGSIMAISNPVMTLLMNIGIIGVISLAAVRVANGSSAPETVLAFMQYFTLLSMAMMTLSRIFVMYTKCAASAGRIAEVLETPTDLAVKEAPFATHGFPHIAFREVSFSYAGKHDHLRKISFSLPRGGRLGIIGATGSGKSTLIRLLLRFYDASEGCVEINGRSVSTYDPATLSAMFGVALQNDFLYADTIAENIRFGRDISDEAIFRAARIAQAQDFITAFPDGYGHMLAQKGTNLSGGQKQRLLIARAIAADPEILILDDSSSALDYKTDASLRQALSRELGDTTVITVAQRVSSVKDCDLILVLEEGEVIGQGTHGSLLEGCSVYKEISDSQMGGAFVE